MTTFYITFKAGSETVTIAIQASHYSAAMAFAQALPGVEIISVSASIGEP